MSTQTPSEQPATSGADSLMNMAGTTTVRRVINEEVMLHKKGYSIGLMIGEGSYATVHACQLNNNGRYCALKIVNKNKAPKDFLQKFLPREIEILSQVQHRNIVKCFDIFDTGNKIYMVLEMAGHGDLLEYIKLRRCLTEEKARSFFSQMIDGVSYLHNMNVVHRDLKCENILLGATNTIKICDFGFARYMQPQDLSMTYCGSAAYAAPEILKGKPYNGKASDVWSLGIILYIMVWGTMPFNDSNINQMIKDQMDQRLFITKKKELTLHFKDIVFAILQPLADSRLKANEIPNHPWMQDGSNTNTNHVLASQQAGTSGASTSTVIHPYHLITTSPPAHPPTPTPATRNLVDSSRIGGNNTTTQTTPRLRESRSSDSSSRFKQNLTRRSKKIVASAVRSVNQGCTTSCTVDVGNQGRAKQGKATTKQNRLVPY